jgi:predicted nucleic-acid-binding protein
MWVLDAVYDRTPEQIALAVEMLLDHKSLSLEDADVVASALQIFRAHAALSFSDCMVVEVARKAGHIPLATFDRGLGKIKGAKRL